MYIQDKVEEYADEVFDLLDKGVSLLLSFANMLATELSQMGLIGFSCWWNCQSHLSGVMLPRSYVLQNPCYPHPCPALAGFIRAALQIACSIARGESAEPGFWHARAYIYSIMQSR